MIFTTWVDPIVERNGADPCSPYVELFWLPVIGPTATLIYRRVATNMKATGGTWDKDLTELATEMGMRYTADRPGPFSKALERLVMFGHAHHTEQGMAVRRTAPLITGRHLKRMPESLQQQHRLYIECGSPTESMFTNG